jgi:hypothetical protein
MWGIWLVTFGIVFSKMGVVAHTAYVASLAPPVAALSAAGIVMFGRWYRAGDWRGLLLPVAAGAELAWADRLWSYFPGFLPWARWAVITVGAAAAVALAVAWPSQHAARTRDQAVEQVPQQGRRTQPKSPAWRVRAGILGEPGSSPRIRNRLAAAALAVCAATMLAAPVTWALSVLDPGYAGGSFNAIAGPSGEGGNPFHITTTLDRAERRLYAYLSAHRDGASYLMSVQSWSRASPYILATGQEVLPMGGFSGQALQPTVALIQQLVSSGQLRFFQLSNGFPNGPEWAQITSWVKKTCRTIPAQDYSHAPAVGARPSPTGRNTMALYECGKGS